MRSRRSSTRAQQVGAVDCQDPQHRGLHRLQLVHIRAHAIDLPADMAQVLKDVAEASEARKLGWRSTIAGSLSSASLTVDV